MGCDPVEFTKSVKHKSHVMLFGAFEISKDYMKNSAKLYYGVASGSPHIYLSGSFCFLIIFPKKKKAMLCIVV